MEDPESEWAIQEYSPPKEGGPTMVKWILNKGYVIGKKMVITGIAITSAPLVLPPLAVFSAMGVAFSVPFGFVFASYVCTNSLMNRLLPTPPSPLLLEYYADEYETGVDCKFGLDEGGDDYEDDEQEEEEGIWETKVKVEALMSNVDGDVDEKGYYIRDEEKGEEEDMVQDDYNDLMEDYKEEIEALIGKIDENFDEKERGDDQDDVIQREYDIEEEEREQMEDVNQGIEMRLGFDMADDEHKVSTTNSRGVDEQGYVEDYGEYVEEDDDSLREERKKDEMEEMVEGNTGSLERIRDEGKIDDEVEDESDLNEVFEEDKDVEMKEPVAVKDIESQKLVKDEEPVGEMHRVVILAEGNEENNFNSREVEELDLVAREVVGNTREDERKMEYDEKVMKDNTGKTGGDTYNDGSEDANLKTKKEHLIDSNEDAREIGDKSGLDLFDERSTSINFGILEGGDKVKENTANDHVEVMALPGFSHALLDSENVKVTSKTEIKTPSREVSTSSSSVDEQGYEEDDEEYLEEYDNLQEERNKKEELTKDEMEEIVKGSAGLLEKIRDEGKIHDVVEHESGSKEVSEESKDVEMTEIPVTIIEIESQKLVKDESKNEEVAEMHRVVISAEENEENNFNSIKIEELDLVAREVVGDMEENSCKTSNDESEDAILRTKKAHLIDLFDESNKSMNFETLEGGKEKEATPNEHADVMALPGFRHATDRKTPSREDILEDEKIWEKIGAMRAIVGYKAPSQPTSIEELKALYVFTGVEPPASFKGDSDPNEVNANLKFLMSVIGVK